MLKVFVCVIFTVSQLSQSTANVSTQRHLSGDDSLYLTPLIDRDDIDTARGLSKVKLSKVGSELLSHSGFITVDKQLGNQLFFWHFISQQNTSAPLMMWLNGGPGVSSMFGMLWEHGPLAVEKKKLGYSYVLRNHTWVGPFSVVYVDNPVGVGYSYSEMGEDGYRLTQEGYTQDLYNFVLQFFKLFPEYKNREFYIGGQSYAGKYVPALAHRIHEQRHNECREVPLTGIILGGPYFDPPTESVAFFDYLYALGAISYADKNNYKVTARSVYQEFLQRGLLNATTSNIFRKILHRDDIGVESLNNYVTGETPNYLQVAVVMASAEFRKAIHVDQKRKFFVFNEKVHNAFVKDFFVSTKPQMAVLMDNYKVLVYNGDYDVVVSSVMIEAALMTTNWTMQGQYNSSHRLVWNSCERLRGFFSQTERFCRVVVHGAGHQTPHDMPDATLEMVTDFLNHGCIKQEAESTKSWKDIAGTGNVKGCGMTLCFTSNSFWFIVVLLFIVKSDTL